MIMRIKKGRHGNFHFPIPLFIKNKSLIKKVTFTDSCRYDIGDDQSDTNKLFGIGYLPYHRKNSARFGWRYIKETDCIELMIYWYKKGIRQYESLCEINLNKQYICEISSNNNSHVYFVKTIDGNILSTKSIDLKGRFFGYKLFSYFGGNMKAPHDIIIDIE